MEFCRTAEYIPMGIASSHVKVTVNTANTTVSGRRSPVTVVIGIRRSSDIPKSNRTRFHTQNAYWTSSGLSSPNCARIFSISSGVMVIPWCHSPSTAAR